MPGAVVLLAVGACASAAPLVARIMVANSEVPNLITFAPRNIAFGTACDAAPERPGASAWWSNKLRHTPSKDDSPPCRRSAMELAA
jgi:hypothetical protein